jgi:hypothetical protein
LLQANQEVRILEKGKNINMDFAIFSNKLAITSFEKNHFLVVIKSESLVNLILPIFELA